MFHLPGFILQSFIEAFKEIFLLDLVNLEEIGPDAIQSSLDGFVTLELAFPNGTINDCCNYFRKVVYVLALFHLNVEQCTL